MAYEFKPDNDFLSDFGNALHVNIQKFELQFDGTGGSATMVETFAQAVLRTNGTAASMFIAAGQWLQGTSNQTGQSHLTQ